MSTTNWPAMRKRKIIVIVVLLMLLVAGLAVFLLTRDSGPPVRVFGNLSAKDVEQIKRAVKRELWKEAFPNFSGATFRTLPRSIGRALRARVVDVEGGRTNEAFVTMADPYNPEQYGVGKWHELFITNGPDGWAYSRLMTHND